MTDLRFDDVVETNTLIGPDGRCAKSVCLSCSQQHKVTRNDFSKENSLGNTYIPSSVGLEIITFVSKMRAWNCCHENTEPIDGFPDKQGLPGEHLVATD